MSRQFYQSKAFTLIELLVTVTILSIIVLVALPSYSKYSLRAKVGAMYEAATPAKLIITNDWHNNGNCSLTNYTYNTTTSTPQFLKPTTYISSISVATGVITITGAAANLNNNAINLTIKPAIDSQQQVTWTCCVSSDSFFDYAPQECRNSASVCAAMAGC